ncbi:hypothetical protein EDB85DRAFT_2273907 [Lactarius pseudohatsudake]|nr:hypothetical protein EDB85DRAFT_2273907 [Lactarius pseudohatsudake]
MPNVAYQGLCFLHEHKIAHCAYGDPNGVMMVIGRSSSAGFDRTRLPELPHEADSRSASFCCDVCDCGAMFQTLVDEVNIQPRRTVSAEDRGKAAVACCGDDDGQIWRRHARKLFEALCKGIDGSTYDTPLQIP